MPAFGSFWVCFHTRSVTDILLDAVKKNEVFNGFLDDFLEKIATKNKLSVTDNFWIQAIGHSELNS